MHISHLSLSNFRNYRRLDIALPAAKIVLEGDNAQGKTNLLEAIFLLATTRSPRATNEGELIGWGGGDEFFPGARLIAQVHTAQGQLQLEVILRAPPRKESPNTLPPSGAEDYLFSTMGGIRKQVRLNGLPRRAADVVGQMKVVMFSAADIDLVAGAPALRRRYLDIALCQLDSRYLRSLQRYQRVLLQRNHLLRRLAEGQARPEELAFWDRELVEQGSYIAWRRHEMVGAVAPLGQEIHHGLTAGQEKLVIRYLPSLSEGWGEANDPISALGQAFRQALAAVAGREIAQGMSLIGPHRDDLQFLVNGADMGTFGSRGQQRAIVQSLKLAEARLIRDKAGEAPILILDDVLSELDSRRQQQLLQAVEPYPQVFITATGPEPFPRDFLTRSARFKVKQGALHPVEA